MTALDGSTDSLVERLFWSRHANPRSVWTLVVAYPVLIFALYRRRRLLLSGTLLFVAVNPLVFSPPATDDAWATRVVLGEKIWLERGRLVSADSLFVAVCAPVFLYTIRSAVRRNPLGTAVGTLLSVALMLVFFDRMVRLYERELDS